MTENTGHMAYNFEGLERQVTWSQAEARGLFLHYFALKNSYCFSQAIDYEELDTVLQDECYLVFNHESRYKGRQVFFTGHGVRPTKRALLQIYERTNRAARPYRPTAHHTRGGADRNSYRWTKRSSCIHPCYSGGPGVRNLAPNI